MPDLPSDLVSSYCFTSADILSVLAVWPEMLPNSLAWPELTRPALAKALKFPLVDLEMSSIKRSLGLRGLSRPVRV